MRRHKKEFRRIGFKNQKRGYCMSKFIKGLLAIAALTFSLNLYAADKDGWLDNFDDAKAQAKKQGLPILMDFTGSDWCGWCIKLDKEVFSQKEFKEYAKKSLILFKADFPREKSISAKVRKQNDSLQDKYGVQGYPTIILVDAEGKKIAQTGYKDGGAKNYVEHLNKLLEKSKADAPASK